METIVTICVAILAFFLGMIFEITMKRRKNPIAGQMVVKDKEEGGKVILLELNKTPEELAKMNAILFKLVPQESPGYEDDNSDFAG